MRNSRRRMISLILTVGMLAGTLAGSVTARGAEGEKTKLTFWT